MNKFSLLLFDIIKKRKTFYFLNEFAGIKHFSKDEIMYYQFNKLKNLLLHAEKNVPFYQKRFADNDIFIKDFNRIKQISLIPPLTRQDLYDNWQDIIAINYDRNKLVKGSSSGSTGHPIFYFKDNYAISAGQAANLLGWSFSGWKMNNRGLHIWGNPYTVNNEWTRRSSKFKAKIFAHHKFPAYQLTDGYMFNELYELINRNKYDFIDGYTNAIYLFADYLKQNDLYLKSKVKYVFTTAENLQEFQRNIVEEMIAPVYDSYGCSEINGIAYECNKCNSYHIIDPHVYVEFGTVVDDDGTRELMITDLDNFAFPLIRYKNGDLGVPTTKDDDYCENNFSSLANITGRQSDIIKFQDGGSLSIPSFFGSMLLKEINGLKQYQIEKVTDNLIYINFVKSADFKDRDLNIIHDALTKYLQGRINYKIRFLDKIESSATGKFKLLVDRSKNT